MDAKIKTVDEINEVTNEDEEKSSEGVVVDSLLSSTEILELPVPYLFSGNMVYIREAYTDIYEEYIERNQHILIIGNPGTGKSLFLPYIVYRVLREHPEDSIVCGHHSMKDSVVYMKGKEAHVLSNLYDATHYYYLYDCGQTFGSDIDFSLAWKATKSIVFSSPDSKNYKEYHKNCIQSCVAQGIQVVMPTWSWDELKFCQKHIYTHISINKLNARFALWGGIPRAVFLAAKVPEHGKGDLSSIVEETSVDAVLSIAHNTAVGKFSKVSHNILHMVVEDKDYQRSFVVFASQNVAQMVYDKRIKGAESKVIEIMYGVQLSQLFVVYMVKCLSPFVIFYYAQENNLRLNH